MGGVRGKVTYVNDKAPIKNIYKLLKPRDFFLIYTESGSVACNLHTLTQYPVIVESFSLRIGYDVEMPMPRLVDVEFKRYAKNPRNSSSRRS